MSMMMIRQSIIVIMVMIIIMVFFSELQPYQSGWVVVASRLLSTVSSE